MHTSYVLMDGTMLLFSRMLKQKTLVSGDLMEGVVLLLHCPSRLNYVFKSKILFSWSALEKYLYSVSNAGRDIAQVPCFIHSCFLQA